MKKRFPKPVVMGILIPALITAVASLVFALNAVNMSGFVWLFFAGFTVATATPHKPKQIPNLIASYAAGWVWAMLMYWICLFTVGHGGSLALGFFLAIFIGSVVMLAIHVGFLMNTWFNNITVIYTAIFCWFAVQDFSKVPYMVICFVVGLVFASVSSVIEGALSK